MEGCSGERARKDVGKEQEWVDGCQEVALFSACRAKMTAKSTKDGVTVTLTRSSCRSLKIQLLCPELAWTHLI